MMNLDKLLQQIELKFGITKEQILSKSRRQNIYICRVILIGYLIQEKNVSPYQIVSYFKMSRPNIYNCLKQYDFLKPDISIFDNIEIEIDPISKDMHLIHYLLERHNITGDLKKYLLDYEKNQENN